MKKIILKCLILGLCIGAVESELSTKGNHVESVYTEQPVTFEELQPRPLNTGGYV